MYSQHKTLQSSFFSTANMEAVTSHISPVVTFDGRCVICLEVSDNAKNKLQTLQQSSIERIREYSISRENNDLTRYLSDNIAQSNVKIHRNCQRNVYNVMRTQVSTPVCGKVRRVETRGVKQLYLTGKPTVSSVSITVS